MPSYDKIWIPTLATGVVVGLILVIYSWEHAFGLVTAFKKKKAPQIPPGEDADDYAPQFKTKKKAKKSKVPDKAVAVDVNDVSLPVVLAWEDIECKVLTGDATAVKTVIKKCSGSFMPGEFVAIMGPSGAGKSTMLDVLAGRKTGQGVEGSVTLNGLPIEPKLAHRCLSYVGQEDVFMPMMTVWESLLFIAKLSMQPMPKVAQRARMNAVLTTLGLARVKDSKVGGLLPGGLDMRGISGGEKRRLSIACGLVANPSIIFLDEPTTGLDSHAALAVMKYLNSLTHLGHTIVSTIHQPRQEIFRSFDKLLLMSEGYVLFLAPPEYVLPWFNEILGIPYTKAKDGTVADWLLGAIAVNFQTAETADGKAMVNVEQVKHASERFKAYVAGSMGAGSVPAEASAEATTEGSPEQLKLVNASTYINDADSEDGTASEAPSKANSLFPSVDMNSVQGGPNGTHNGTNPGLLNTSPSVTSLSNQTFLKANAVASDAAPGATELKNLLGETRSLYATGWTKQFYILFSRFFFQQLRNPTEAGMRLFVSSCCGVFFGLVWIRLNDDRSTSQERLGLIFFNLMMFCMVPFAYMAFPAHDKRFFKLDSIRGLYSPSAYFLAYQCSMAPFIVLNSWATGLVLYGLAGLRYEGWAIIQFNSILGLHALVSQQLLVMAIWWFQTQDMAFTVSTIYITFSLLICGFYIRVNEMTLSVMRGLSWASFSKYTFQALAYTELLNRQWSEPCQSQNVQAPGFGATASICQIDGEKYPNYILYYYYFLLPVYKSCLGLLAFYLGFSLISYKALLRLRKEA